MPVSPLVACQGAAGGAAAGRKKSTVTDGEMSLQDMLRLSTEIVDAIDEPSGFGNTPFNKEVRWWWVWVVVAVGVGVGW